MHHQLRTIISPQLNKFPNPLIKNTLLLLLSHPIPWHGTPVVCDTIEWMTPKEEPYISWDAGPTGRSGQGGLGFSFGSLVDWRSSLLSCSWKWEWTLSHGYRCCACIPYFGRHMDSKAPCNWSQIYLVTRHSSIPGSPVDLGFRDFSGCGHPPALFCSIPATILLSLVTALSYPVLLFPSTLGDTNHSDTTVRWPLVYCRTHLQYSFSISLELSCSSYSLS